MAATLTTFRAAVASALATALAQPPASLTLSFMPGKLEGPSEREPLACLWPVGVEERSGEIDVQDETLMGRVYLQYQTPTPDLPVDPTPLENLVDQIQGAFKGTAQASFGPWYARVTQLRVDVDVQGVEFTVAGFAANLGV
jgi:hypothetical protein